MENKKKVNYIYLVLYLLSILVAYTSSLQSGKISSSESGWITDFLFKIVTDLDFLKLDLDYETLHGIVRKLFGHFGWFFVMGTFGFLTFSPFLEDRQKWLWISLTIGMVVAITSELMQFLAIERSPMGSDMAINFGGYLMSTLLCFLIYKIKRNNNK
jgi:VanZ family protein